MVENGTLLQDCYLIEKQIGAGGMGAVYLAIDQRFGSYVAIKETFYTDDEFGDAFEREAHLLNTLHHPALPHVSDYFNEGEGHFLVMQYIEGEDLSAILKRDGAFPVKDVLRWTDSLLDALDYLHSQEPPIIHRDIKPQNLKITPRGDIILLDFGLAKLKVEDTSGVKSVFGYSRKYSPLEQIQGTGTDARSDIFSLGATAYHLLAGTPPVDVLARAAEIIAGNSDPLLLASEINSEVPVEVANVLNSALALNSAVRFSSAKAMRQALDYSFDTNSDKSSDELSEEVLAVVAPSDKAAISPETEDFPALEAFAAESAVNFTGVDKNSVPRVVEAPTETVGASEEKSEVVPQSTSVVEVPTKIAARRPAQKRFPVAALIALLLLAGLAAGYFINKKAQLPKESDEATAIQPAAKSNQTTDEVETVSPAPVLEETDSQEESESVEHDKEKNLSDEKAERKNSASEPEVETEKAEKTEPVKRETQKPATSQNIRRAPQPQNNGEVRERVVENENLPDIERIFTGRSSRYRNQNVRRQNQRARREDEMTEEEWQEFRHERWRERRRRQNNRPFPF